MRGLLVGAVLLLVILLLEMDAGPSNLRAAMPGLGSVVSFRKGGARGNSDAAASSARSAAAGAAGSGNGAAPDLAPLTVCGYRVVVLKENVDMFGEVQGFLVAGFKELGFDTSYLTPEECNDGGDVNWNTLPPCADYDVLTVSTTLCTMKMVQDMPRNPLWVNLEVLQTEGRAWSRMCMEPGYAEALWSSGPVWDYLHDNVQFLLAQRWTNQDPLYMPLRYYKGIAYTESRYSERPEPSVDVVFVGALFGSPRRKGVLDELRRRGAKVVVLEEVFGEEREKRVRDAKVVLNIHYYPRNFETVRLFWLLSLGCFVVAEGDPMTHEEVMREYEGSMAMVPYDALVDTVMEYLGKPEERRRIADAGYDFVRATTPGQAIRPLIEASLPRECG
jgi:hypothetical protein